MMREFLYGLLAVLLWPLLLGFTFWHGAAQGWGAAEQGSTAVIVACFLSSKFNDLAE